MEAAKKLEYHFTRSTLLLLFLTMVSSMDSTRHSSMLCMDFLDNNKRPKMLLNNHTCELIKCISAHFLLLQALWSCCILLLA